MSHRTFRYSHFRGRGSRKKLRELAFWYATANCKTCIEVFGGEQFTPCTTCRPIVHPYNVSTVILYNSCSDQLIMGFDGAVSINDLAITNAMKNYFTVKKRDRLALSKSVRNLYHEILSIQKARAKTKAKPKKR